MENNQKNDLISREALRKQLKELLDLAVKRVNDTPNNSPCYRMYVEQENERARLIDLIDNAPPVEPDRPQGDCISREAIKKVIVEKLEKWSDGYSYIEIPTDDAIREMTSAINEAEAVKNNWRFYYEHGYKQAERDLKRKQGEWKCYIRSAFHGVDEYGEPIFRPVKVYHCPECNRRTVIKENFCPECGTDLRKDKSSGGI